PRKRAVARTARHVRQAHRRRNREMGQGNQVRRHQATVTDRPSPESPFGEFWGPRVRCGPWPCENSSALRARRSISEKLLKLELNHPAQIQLDTVSENCFFYISPMY